MTTFRKLTRFNFLKTKPQHNINFFFFAIYNSDISKYSKTGVPCPEAGN